MKINKKIIILFILLLLPILFFSWAFVLQKNSGPNYLTTSYRGQHFDPEYAYLFNALNVIHGIPPWHIDHPGTPLQVLGAIIIKIQYPLVNSQKIETIVLNTPEKYLFQINFIINLMIFVTIFFLGVITYLITKKIILALIIQSTPLFSSVIMESFNRITPEPLLLIITLSIIILLISLLKFNLKKHIKIYLFLFSFIMGLGLAIKISCFPLILIPGILFWKEKKITPFLLGVIISFFIFTLPIITRYKSITGWVLRIITHQDNYGHGEVGIDIFRTWNHVLNIISSNWLFTLILVLSIIFIIINLKKKKNLIFYLLSGCVLTQILQLIIVGKHYNIRYMLPAFSLSGFCLVILLYHVSKKIPSKYFNLLTFVIFIFIFTYNSYLINNRLNQIRKIVDQEKYNIAENIQKNNALEFGNFWSGQKYTARLKWYQK